MLESGMTMDFGQLVMDNEFAGLIRHTIKGYTITEDNLSVEQICDVGPGGNYLARDETLQWMRKMSYPETFDRDMRDSWEEKGSKDLYQVSLEKAKEILANHKPAPIPDNIQKEMREIVNEAEKEAGVRISNEA
jgi:trimethylamine---corrinoid protein Co-methyltransferase